MDEKTTFLVVGGCGTIGLSTAWHLARRGYKNITCLDRWPYPSKSSAGYDLNKIVRTEYAEPMYSKLAQEAIELWQDPLFSDVFKKTGWVAGTTSPHPDPARPRASPPPGTLNVRSVEPSISPFLVDSFDRAVENTYKYGDPSGITTLESREDLKNSEWGKYFSGMEAFRGIHNSNAGWVAAAEALAVVGKECKRLGVQFVQGVMEEVVQEGGKIVGIVTEEGRKFTADKVVLALGAYTDSVIDMEGQTLGVAYSITHVRMTEKEQDFYGGMPVIDIEGYGYTFPPREDGVIKFCDLHPGHPWRRRLPGRSDPVSVPRDWAYHGHDQLSIEDRESVRRFVGYCMPEFKDRPFEFSRMCWDLESFDYHWIIAEHPSSPKSLFLATAGSGHTFKNLPNVVGKYVVDCLEGKLSPEHKEAWRWRPDKIGTVPPVERVDLKNLHGWKGDDANE